MDFQALFEQAPGNYLALSKDLQILAVSDGYLRATMTERQSIVGRPLFEVFPDNPSDPQAGGVRNLRASLERVLASGRPHRMDIQRYDIRTAGDEGDPFEERYWSPYNTPVKDDHGEIRCIIHSVEDVSPLIQRKRQGRTRDEARDRKRSDAALRLAAERLSTAIESMQDAFALFDGEQRLLVCNAMYRALLQDSGLVHDWVGLPYAQITEKLAGWLGLSEAERARFHHDFDPARGGPSSIDLRTRDGRSLRLISRPTPEGGFVDTVWDLSEDERRAEALRAARNDAEAASAAKSEFLSSMSHELRTPMNAILGFAQLLQREKLEPLTPKNLQRVSQILRGGEHLLRLIDDVLDFARIEAGRVAVGVDRVDVRSVLEEVLGTLDTDARARAVSLHIDCPSDTLPALAVDRIRTVQVLLNLGSNAVKYNRHGGSVCFAVTLPRKGYMRIDVEDTGLGIPMAHQESLFQPFQRAGQERGPIQGTGIGLMISKRLLALMGGEIGFRSEPGKGSSFWIELPIHADGALPEPVVRVQTSELPPLPNTPRTVLYIEDSPTNVALMKELFRSFSGATLITRATAEDGMIAARALLPDAILMALHLPRMNGLHALAALRADERTRDIPVIALTAAASQADVENGLRAGFLRYVTKPIRVDELGKALHAAYRARPPV